jgi:glucose/arabinose dehydrogenase
MVFPTARPCPGRVAAAGRALLGLSVILLLSSEHARAAIYSVPRFSDTATVQGLAAPTDFAFLPDGRILILEKAGTVRIATPGGGAPTVAIDMTATVDDGSEKGFLGICLHPGFATNGGVFLYYTYDPPGTTPPSRNRISRFTLTGSTISASSEFVVLDNIEATNGNHNGGTILIGPDGKLWAAPGDSGTGGAKAQDLDPASPSRYNGKVLRMELDGSPAAGNPFLGDGTKEPRIYAYGFRNPFRFSFRPSNGSLYVADVGSSGAQDREEVNVVVAGGNYGWPYAEGTTIYVPPCTGCLPPVFDYPRATGTTIIGGAFATGNAYPASLLGRYVFGDNGASWIRYLEFDANDGLVGGVDDALQNLASAAEGPVAFHRGPDGNLYYAAINTGRIFRIDYAKNFFTVPPCRTFDTRDPAGSTGGLPLAAGADRTFPVAGSCGIPPTARAVSVNLAVTEPTGLGFLTLFAAGGAPPLASTINFRAGQTRANNAIVMLGPAGEIVVRSGMASGAVHLILDVNGYFDD